jgi:hypothetical protein
VDFHLEEVHQTAKELTWICHNDLRSWKNDFILRQQLLGAEFPTDQAQALL